MTKPIYDQPDHPSYGPVRRLHIMLMQLFGEDLPKLEVVYKRFNSERSWDTSIDFYLTDKHFKYTEAAAQRRVLKRMLQHFYG